MLFFGGVMAYSMRNQCVINDPLFYGSILFTIVSTTIFFKVQTKIHYIKIFKDRIEIPRNNKSIQIAFENIDSVDEGEVKGSFSLWIKTKDQKNHEIIKMRLDEAHYFEIEEALKEFIPKPVEETPEQKKRTKVLIIGISIIVLVSVLIIGLITGFSGKLFRIVAGIPILGFTVGSLGIVAQNIQKFQRENRQRLLLPAIRSRRNKLNYIVGCTLFLTLGSALYFIRPQNAIYSGFGILYPSLLIPPLVYIAIDKIMRLEEFVSSWERGLYFGCFLIFGFMNLIFSGPHMIKALYTQKEFPQEAILRYSGSNKGNACFTFNLDSFNEPSLCSNVYPTVRAGAKVIYTKRVNLSGVNLYSDFIVQD